MYLKIKKAIFPQTFTEKQNISWVLKITKIFDLEELYGTKKYLSLNPVPELIYCSV